MKKKALAPTLFLMLLFSSLFYGSLIQPVESQSFETIYIRVDGSVEGTDKIHWEDNIYTLTDDIFSTIEVEKDNIEIDGAGHPLHGRGINEINTERGIYLKGLGWGYPKCGNVSIKNFRISNFLEGIHVAGGRNNSILGNYFEKANIHLIGNANLTGDLIKHNTFKDWGIFVDYNPGGIDVITENNFIDCGIYVGLSVAPIVDRNYWSDYLEKYPDAKELDGSGIWDTPYVDDRYEEDISCIDYHPLISPVAIPAFPEPTPTLEPTPTPTLTPMPHDTPEPSEQEVILGLVFMVAIIGGSLVLFVYLMKRK